MEDFVNGIVCAACVLFALSYAIESGVKHGIKSALKDVEIKFTIHEHK